MSRLISKKEEKEKLPAGGVGKKMKETNSLKLSAMYLCDSGRWRTVSYERRKTWVLLVEFDVGHLLHGPSHELADCVHIRADNLIISRHKVVHFAVL